ncbi:MAG: hypothetical protein Harvfovirus78_1 [Harvfovirus sp.]|uniref:Uncharacterized protein n=1 Tax=Harvfovirus sp. TaxID=2487768 RepID=A0A3G5A3V2_9VIRU|nr:MAG: hypothetical protein Harvfovirus78_1 [Harvfovirus sp.]
MPEDKCNANANVPYNEIMNCNKKNSSDPYLVFEFRSDIPEFSASFRADITKESAVPPYEDAYISGGVFERKYVPVGTIILHSLFLRPFDLPDLPRLREYTQLFIVDEEPGIFIFYEGVNLPYPYDGTTPPIVFCRLEVRYTEQPAFLLKINVAYEDN